MHSLAAVMGLFMQTSKPATMETLSTPARANRCTLATCGDGIVHEGAEVCDDGNQLQTDACLIVSLLAAVTALPRGCRAVR